MFFNHLWKAAAFPRCWKSAHIIPLLKPGKDPSLPASYRPIALTSCLGKTYERLINRRLVYFLEEENILDINQCGFREGRSATDHLVRLETFIREAFVHRQHCVSVFFDLQKAYDTTWRYGILRDLHNYGVRGRMLQCVQNFLSDRTFQVRLGSTLSDVFPQENGVPQGGVLSVTLFAIKINSLASVIPPSVFYSLYVDDVQISVSSCNLSSCERQLQLTVNRMSKWADENGFTFSPEKTVCVPFSLRRGLSLDPSLHLNHINIPVHQEHKFLGIILDKKLTFVPHLKELKRKCLKSSNILKVLSHNSWGSDRRCLLRLYNSLVRSRLDYGAIVYGSARPSTLKMLDPVHHLGLRLATGAFRTSPVLSLYADTFQMSLEKRRQYLSLSYVCRVYSNPQHPSYSTIRTCRFSQLFENKPSIVRPLNFRIQSLCASLQFPLNDAVILKHKEKVAPWDEVPIFCDWSLTKYNKRAISPQALQQEFQSLQDTYRDYTEFYTDGSKSSSFVGCAVYSGAFTKALRMDSMASIFSAEIYGVSLAIEHIMSNNILKAILFVDSQSVIQALSSRLPTKNLLVLHVRSKINRALQLGRTIRFCWVPSHVGIPGNEQADKLAASAKDLAASFGLPYQDLRPLWKKALLKTWQSEWDVECNNKLHVIKPVLALWESSFRKERRLEVLLCRLRIGHSRLTHLHLLCGEDEKLCAHCGEVLTVLHILWQCRFYHQHRRQSFPELFRGNLPFHPMFLLGDHPLVSHDRVFDFLKKTGYIHQL